MKPSPAKVLLVDDDPAIVAALDAALSLDGYEVIPAFNGHQAIQQFYKHPGVAIVLLDICMPVKGGWQTLERLATINPLLPVIVITARSDQSALAATAGADALLEKPFDVRQLLVIIKRLLAEPKERRLTRRSGAIPPKNLIDFQEHHPT